MPSNSTYQTDEVSRGYSYHENKKTLPCSGIPMRMASLDRPWAGLLCAKEEDGSFSRLLMKFMRTLMKFSLRHLTGAGWLLNLSNCTRKKIRSRQRPANDGFVAQSRPTWQLQVILQNLILQWSQIACLNRQKAENCGHVWRFVQRGSLPLEQVDTGQMALKGRTWWLAPLSRGCSVGWSFC